jgi:hypothetical protein
MSMAGKRKPPAATPDAPTDAVRIPSGF